MLTITVLTREVVRLMLLQNPGRVLGNCITPVRRTTQLHVNLLVEEAEFDLSLDEFSAKYLGAVAYNLVGCAKHHQGLLIKAPLVSPATKDCVVEYLDGVEVRGLVGKQTRVLGAQTVLDTFLRFDVGVLKLPRY